MAKNRLNQLKPKLEKRAGKKTPKIVGYAAVFFDKSDPDGTQFDLFGDGTVMERIGRGAFKRALREAHDVRALFNHSPDNLLGRTASGTLRLWTDTIGLRYAITPPLSALTEHILQTLARGDLNGSSFAFRVVEGTDTFTTEGDVRIRTINDLELFDVGPVVYPAYLGAGSELNLRIGTAARGRSKTPKLELYRRKLKLLELECTNSTEGNQN